jgi:hypothetical protein
MRTVTEGLEITHFDAYQSIQDESLSSITISHQALTGSLVHSSTYTSVTFSSCVFYGCNFKYVIFRDCNFNNTNFDFSHFYNCMFINCTFEDCKWPASTMHESEFTDCELDPWISHLTESHSNVIRLTYAEKERAREVQIMLAAAFTAA